MLPKNSIKKDIKPKVCHEFHCTLSKRHKQEKVHAICRSSKDNKTTITSTRYEGTTAAQWSSYTRAFGDGPHNFESWSSDEDDT
ncbi:hypothetical protein TNCV_3589061 [Trichonephila clavipes]|nr:hypothetical protein TNCV_3589061 [Trichonephila clavipes]